MYQPKFRAQPEGSARMDEINTLFDLQEQRNRQ
jgi:hypothetical protein